ncbi:MAG: hypothetical protein V9G19_17765 [Tetrasphaera sp.]
MTKQPYADDDLERITRAGLAHHAQSAPVELPAAQGDSTSTTRDRARRRWLLPAAAAVVALAVPVGYQLARGGGSDAGTPPLAGGPSTATSASATASSSPSSDAHRTIGTGARPSGIPANWRPESYDGVQLWVPPTWGWGGAPMRADWNGDQPLDCSGGRAFTIPGSSDYEFVPDTPYVGRPVMMTDACGGSLEARPSVEAVWFDAAGIEPGTQTYADGVVRETRIIGDVTVSVFSSDPALRERILGSAQRVDIDANGCPTSPPNQQVDSTWTEGLEPSALSVCVYSNTGATLLWSGQVGADRATAYAAAVGLGTAGAHRARPPERWTGDQDAVYLGLRSLGAADDNRVRWDRYSPTSIVSPDGKSVVMTPATVANTAPWAKDSGGVKAYVVGGGADIEPAVQKFFRGILG